MTLPYLLEPDNARITIPVVLGVGYVVFHWWRWWLVRKSAKDEDELDSESPATIGTPTSVNAVNSVQPAANDDLVCPQQSEPKIEIDPAIEAEKLEKATRFWTEARGKVHSEIPDFSTDWQYMNLLYKAANLGHTEAMSKLGDYAYRREDLVEAFYWKQLAEAKGVHSVKPSLTDIIDHWLAAGCPEELESIHMGFSEAFADFARAVLYLKSGANLELGRRSLSRLAENGDENARRFLHRK